MSKDKPTREVIAEYLDYDPATGMICWIKATGRQPAGAIAGYVRLETNGEYRRLIRFSKRTYRASNIAWVLMTGEWPSQMVDHHNTDSLDDRWANLRLATNSQNQMNRRARRGSVSGFKGVHYNQYKGWKFTKPWVAQIEHQHIGNFATAEEAARAYDAEAIKRFGEFAYLNFPRST